MKTGKEKVYDIPCQRCGHVTLRYHGELPKSSDSLSGLLNHARFLDGTKVTAKDLAKCSECDEYHLEQTFAPRNWQEYKDFDPDMTRLPTHGHKGDSPHTG